MASSDARKRAARDCQRQFPGTPYPIALRAVSQGPDSLQVTIGETDGHSYWVNIEEASSGGNGPHIAVTGSSEIGRRRVVELMTDSLAARPPRRGVEVLTTHGDFGRINELIDERTRQLQQCAARDFTELRRRIVTDPDGAGGTAHALVVVVDGEYLIERFGSDDAANDDADNHRQSGSDVAEASLSALDRLLRCGRSLDIHTVLDVRALTWRRTSLSGLVSSVVEVDDSGTAAAWRTLGVRGASVDLVLPMGN